MKVWKRINIQLKFNVIILLLLNNTLSAHDNVVVVPLGGAEGDATKGDVIEGKTFSSQKGKRLVGNMVDNGTVTLIPGTLDKSIPHGYHNGSGVCKGDANLLPENIPAGITIFGINGSLTQQFTINGDGTVTDHLSRLTWQQVDDDVTRNWNDSKTYCTGLDLGGYAVGSWRLPSKEELKGLVRCSNGASTPLTDETTCGAGYRSPTIDIEFQSETSRYWTSSENGQSLAWNVNFSHGGAYSFFRTESLFVRCVR